MSRPKTGSSDPLRLEFTPTVSVTTARSHKRYVECPMCQRDTATYLFHRAGVRFVRCAGCGAVYVNPAREHPINNLDVDKLRPPRPVRHRTRA